MMGLLPLEFTDCLTNSPYFRENLHAHEKELERTSQSIKILIKEVKELLSAAKQLSRAQRNLASTLKNFKLECIGSSQTDDERIIADALKEFGKLLNAIEDERDRMLDQAQAAFIDPIENFRKEYIGGAKDRKKKFDKETTRFVQSQDRHLNLSTKKSGLQEADASLETEQRLFSRASLEYILFLQEVQERKKFEFVETILSFVYGWLTFYHQGHEVATDFKPFTTDLQKRLQKTRENFEATNDEAKQLMFKLLDNSLDPGSLNKMFTRQGYLYLMEKKALGTTWTKHYCQYQKENHKFTMIPYSQSTGKIALSETIVLKECIRRMSDSIDKRFCFDVTAEDRPGTLTFQALSEEDRRLWLDAMDGKEPAYSHPGNQSKQEEFYLDEIGFSFVQQCVDVIESKGLEDEGLYRVVGVSSKVNKLTQMALDRRRSEPLNLEDPDEWEIKTITSALKNYLRNLPEPLMTFRLNSAFINAAKLNMDERIDEIHSLVQKLPKPNYSMLQILIAHLYKVSEKSDKNLMTASNLGACFGPTLLRAEEETMAGIMDIKFRNIVLEILIEHCHKIFSSIPPSTTLPTNDQLSQRRFSSPPNKQAHNNGPQPEPVAPQRRKQQRDTVYVMDSATRRGSAGSNRGGSPRAESLYLADGKVMASYHVAQKSTYTANMTSSGTSVHTSMMSRSQPSIANVSVVPVVSSTRSSVTSSSQRNVSTTRKPLVVYNPSWNDNPSSSSSSSESLHSPRSTANHHFTSHSSSPSSSSIMKSSSSHHQPLSHGGSPTVRTSASHHQLATTGHHHGIKTSPSSHHQLGGHQSVTNGSHSSHHQLSHHTTTSLKTSPSSHLSTTSSSKTSPSSSAASSSHRRLADKNFSPAHSPSRQQRLGEGGGREKPRRSSSRGSGDSGHQRHGSAGSREYRDGSRQMNFRVRTLYACVGENESELSFEPNQIIYNVRHSHEPGWLIGCLNGRTGLVPENYVEPLP